MVIPPVSELIEVLFGPDAFESQASNQAKSISWSREFETTVCPAQMYRNAYATVPIIVGTAYQLMKKGSFISCHIAV